MPEPKVTITGKRSIRVECACGGIHELKWNKETGEVTMTSLNMPKNKDGKKAKSSKFDPFADDDESGEENNNDE